MNFPQNIWALFYVLFFIGVLLISMGLLLRWVKFKHDYVSFYLGYFFLVYSVFIFINQLNTRKKEMKEREGVYCALRQNEVYELCKDLNVDSLQLTLEKSGKCYFNFKTCFINNSIGTWTWNEDMVGAWISIDINLKDQAHLTFDEKDTLRLYNQNNIYITFAKKKMQK